MASSSAISLIITPAPGIVAVYRSFSLYFLSLSLALALPFYICVYIYISLSFPLSVRNDHSSTRGFARRARTPRGCGKRRAEDRGSVTRAPLYHRRPYCSRGAAPYLHLRARPRRCRAGPARQGRAPSRMLKRCAACVLALWSEI